MHGDQARGMDRADERDYMDERDERDYMDERDFADELDYMDERRGVKGTGRRRRRRRRDRASDSNDFNDFADFGGNSGEMKLSRRDKAKWMKNLESDSGEQGPHFDADEIRKVAEQMNIDYDGYSPSDICVVANMLYSDIGSAFTAFIPKDKEIYCWLVAAKKWLEDNDSNLEGAEKLMAYYHLIVNG